MPFLEFASGSGTMVEGMRSAGAGGVNSTTDCRVTSLGLVAVAVGAAPRTARNDLYHRLVLAAIAVGFLPLLVSPRARLQL